MLETALTLCATTHEHLEAYDLSLQDYQHVLQLQPSNPVVSDEGSN